MLQENKECSEDDFCFYKIDLKELSKLNSEFIEEDDPELNDFLPFNSNTNPYNVLISIIEEDINLLKYEFLPFEKYEMEEEFSMDKFSFESEFIPCYTEDVLNILENLLEFVKSNESLINEDLKIEINKGTRDDEGGDDHSGIECYKAINGHGTYFKIEGEYDGNDSCIDWYKTEDVNNKKLLENPLLTKTDEYNSVYGIKEAYEDGEFLSLIKKYGEYTEF